MRYTKKSLCGTLLTSCLGVVRVMARCLFISKYRTVTLMVSCPLFFSCSSQLATFTLRHLYGITNVRINTPLYFEYIAGNSSGHRLILWNLKVWKGFKTVISSVCFRNLSEKKDVVACKTQNLDASHQVGVVCYNFRPAIFSQKLLYTGEKWGTVTISMNQFAINQSIKNDNNNNVWLWNWNGSTCTGTDQIGLLLSEIFHLHIITVLWPWLSYTLLLFLLSLKFTQAIKTKPKQQQPVYNSIVKNKKYMLAKKTVLPYRRLPKPPGELI